MANPVGFEGANVLLTAPEGVPQEECGDMSVCQTDEQTISCWRLTEAELATVNETGVVWVGLQMWPPCPLLVSGHALVTFENKRPAKAEPYIAPAKRVEGNDD